MLYIPVDIVRYRFFHVHNSSAVSSRYYLHETVCADGFNILYIPVEVVRVQHAVVLTARHCTAPVRASTIRSDRAIRLCVTGTVRPGFCETVKERKWKKIECFFVQVSYSDCFINYLADVAVLKYSQLHLF